MSRILFIVLLFQSISLLAQSNANQWLSLVSSFSKTSAVTGREEEAAEFVQSLFASGTLKKDNLGNLVLTIGSGSPKRLFAAPLDEPGYLVSSIQENGYLRITPAGFGHYGNLFHQFLEGNEIKINTATGSALGVAIVPSSHYEGLRAVPENSKEAYQWQEAFIDVGAGSIDEVNKRDIQLLDPLTANKKPSVINNEYIAASSVKSKAAVMALASVAQTLIQTKFKGSVVIAFTTLELLNGKGLESVLTKYGPFDQVIRFNRFLTKEFASKSEILSDKKLPFVSSSQSKVKPDLQFRHFATTPDWDTTKVFSVGLPSRYTYTPAEMVHVSSIEELAQTWLHAVEDKSWSITPIKSPIAKESVNEFQTSKKESDLLSKLISLYGVSQSEKPVRDFILTQMPSWAKPVVDSKGNIVLSFGKGKQHIAFVAHMDEVGYSVDSIRKDGRLVLKQRGGFFNSVWEGHSAIVHAEKDIPAVFEPRENYLTATARANGTKAPLVFAGYTSKEEAVKAGIKVGVTTVTMPKQMIRLTEEKATARGFDDRVGCASLLLALQNIKPDELPFKVTFVWSVEEEIGLLGATFSSQSLKDIKIIYPIDTFVSSDDPVDPRLFGYCPLGNGAVIRVLESFNMIGRANLTYLQQLSAKKNIKTQYGMTAGGTDGQAFLKYDIPSVPLSWPGRYSHSPVEVMDFRDMSSLVQLIEAIVMDEEKTY